MQFDRLISGIWNGFLGRVMLTDLLIARHTLWQMATAQLRSRYAGSVLGIFWAVATPLLIMGAITFVFTVVFRADIKDFPLLVLSGMMPWMFFSNTLSEACGSILGQQSLLRQFKLPVAVLPLGSVLANFLNFLVGWAVIYPLFVFFNPKILVLAPLLVFILACQLFLVSGFALALSVLNVFFRDVGHVLGVMLMFWFWVTPVFYTLDMVPAQFLWVYQVNPVTPFIVFYQDIIFSGQIPSGILFIQVILWTMAVFVSGIVVFMAMEPQIVKKL